MELLYKKILRVFLIFNFKQFKIMKWNINQWTEENIKFGKKFLVDEICIKVFFSPIYSSKKFGNIFQKNSKSSWIYIIEKNPKISLILVNISF